MENASWNYRGTPRKRGGIMNYYGYISTYYNSTSDIRNALEDYAQAQGFTFTDLIDDPENNRKSWHERKLQSLISRVMKPGDVLVIYEASNLARSTAQILEILETANQHGIHMHLVKYQQTFPTKDNMTTKDFLTLVGHIESDFVAKRVTDALSRRKAAGLPIGRPKGRLNKSLKLDKHRKEIQKYLNLNVSRASIAKLIGCNPQTLYNYIEKRGLKAQKEV
jgi:DNA invertase Pin-like site-specific DNA recombinase